MANEGRRAPRISVNKLGEYLTATPARRKRIVFDQKYPPAYQVIRYRDAEKAISECIASGRDPKVLAMHRARLADKAPSTDYEAQTALLCIEAIDCFEELMPDLDFNGAEASAGPTSSEPVIFSGVAVSVRPEVTLTGRDRSGPYRGFAKLYFAKSVPLTDESGAYVATVVSEYASRNSGGKVRVDPSRVIVLDIFGGRAYAAPRARTRRLENVTAACEEIAVRWEAA
jgi:hypothetical protein